MRQELLDFLQAHLARMTLAVKQNEAFDPTQIGVFGAYAIVPGTNRVAYLFQEFGGLSLHHRALLVETAEEVAFYAVHMCSIAETKAPGQGADRSVGLKPNNSSIRLGAVKHGILPCKDRPCPFSTGSRRTRRRTAVKRCFFYVLDGTRPSLRFSGRTGRPRAV